MNLIKSELGQPPLGLFWGLQGTSRDFISVLPNPGGHRFAVQVLLLGIQSLLEAVEVFFQLPL